MRAPGGELIILQVCEGDFASQIRLSSAVYGVECILFLDWFDEVVSQAEADSPVDRRVRWWISVRSPITPIGKVVYNDTSGKGEVGFVEKPENWLDGRNPGPFRRRHTCHSRGVGTSYCHICREYDEYNPHMMRICINYIKEAFYLYANDCRGVPSGRRASVSKSAPVQGRSAVVLPMKANDRARMYAPGMDNCIGTRDSYHSDKGVAA